MRTTNKSTPIIIAETKVDQEGLLAMLGHIGAFEWTSDAVSEQDLLTEVAGRLCYKSFGVGLNPNITKVREGNREYLGNVQGQRHGSVFEHASTSIAFLDVSRILTHELVRHRVGTAYSQESQRFVRLDDLSVYIPDLSEAFEELYETHLNEGRFGLIGANEEGIPLNGYDKDRWVGHMQHQYFEAFDAVGKLVEKKVGRLIQELGLDKGSVSFHAKKLVTSALRRFAPGGVNTNILVTTNNRNWRYLIEARTSGGAEVEIVDTFKQVAALMIERHPNSYQDMIVAPDKSIKFLNSKI